MLNRLPLIFDIVKGSFSDGPGVRTTVFLKGCPLHCPWCHNPESHRYEKETIFYPEACIGCNNCKKDKPCHALARREVGQFYSPEQLALEIAKDKPYYDISGGGVTFSGGEALSHIDYLSEVSAILKTKGIHVAVQTSGCFNYKEFAEKLLHKIDLIYFDFKIMNEAEHLRILGRSNREILENFEKVADSPATVIPRVALIPDYVANKENLAAIADFLSEKNVNCCEFLYYNPASKNNLPSKTFDQLTNKPVTAEKNSEWIRFFKDRFKEKRERHTTGCVNKQFEDAEEPAPHTLNPVCHSGPYYIPTTTNASSCRVIRPTPSISSN